MKKINLIISFSGMGTPDQRALGGIMRTEWPDLKREIASFERYSRDGFLTEAVIVKLNGSVIGGNYVTNHPDELEKFFKETPDLRGKNLVVAEYFVMKPKVRNQGFGKRLLEFVKKRYLETFDGIVLKSNIIETQNFYRWLGGEVIFFDKDHRTEHHKVWGREILKQGTSFLYTKGSA